MEMENVIALEENSG